MEQYCYKCNAFIPAIDSKGVKIGKKKCGNKFSSNIELKECPKCLSEDITLIPAVFLKLWDTDKNVRYYVTETMDIRAGLTSEETHVARQILNKYAGITAGLPEYCI